MKKSLINLLITVISLLLFVPFIGRLHLFDWDEINFAESAREMLVTGDYLTVRIFFEPFWEKPPLFIWFQAISMKLFGINEFAARFPNAIAGAVTLLILFNIGTRIKNQKFGIIWVLTYASSILPFLYFKSGIIDPWFNLFIFLGVFFWAQGIIKETSQKKYISALLAAVFIGLAVLTKGPVAILVFGLTIGILFCFNRFRVGYNLFQIVVFILALTLVGGFWFLLQILNGNFDLVIDFINYQIRLFKREDAGHGGFPLYHFVVLFFGVFPVSILAIYGHWKGQGIQSEQYITFRKTMIILFWVVLILFSIVKTKIVHYSSLCYFPLSFLAAHAVYSIIKSKMKYRSWIAILIAIVGFIISLIIITLPVFDKNKQWFIEKEIVTHSFTIGNLQADPGWTYLTSTIGLILITGILITLVFFKSKRFEKGFLVLSMSSILFIDLSLTFVTPGAEKYSQNVVIEFFKEHKDEDAYMYTFYKSYAMLFYGERLPGKSPSEFNGRYLTQGDIDKPVYMVLRIDKKQEILPKYPDVKILYEKNGYVFCIRHPKTEDKTNTN